MIPGHLVSAGYIALKELSNGDVAGIHHFMFTCAILRFSPSDWKSGYCDRWCYDDESTAKRALQAWDGTGEPTGWHRHPSTGRRREHGDPTTEYINP